jgi:DHA1 family bicyclomycin/chloramphenicol resistance-like MFS transporter
MRYIKEKNHPIVTLLAFASIPITGLATDVYLPSLPTMAKELHVNSSAMQATLLIFIISCGLTQLFIGTFLDSFGRYRIGSAFLLIFTFSSILIALSHNIFFIYVLRAVQGISAAVIVVAKRAYFIDTYTGDKLKSHISMFSIIWATAPIVAPFLGGYLQNMFGWQANFYFLALFSGLILLGDILFSGESLRVFLPFKMKSITNLYISMLKTKDYILGLLLISISYGMLLVFGFSSPFIIEHVFHQSPVVTGYSALFSGTALMTGGIISRTLISKYHDKKFVIAIGLQILIVAGMIITTCFLTSGLYSMMLFVILMHITSGFLFNNLFAWCLSRFAKHGGVVSGLTGGSLFIIASILSYSVVFILSVKSQLSLGFAYLVFVILNIIVFYIFQKFKPMAIEQ